MIYVFSLSSSLIFADVEVLKLPCLRLVPCLTVPIKTGREPVFSGAPASHFNNYQSPKGRLIVFLRVFLHIYNTDPSLNYHQGITDKPHECLKRVQLAAEIFKNSTVQAGAAPCYASLPSLLPHHFSSKPPPAVASGGCSVYAR